MPKTIILGIESSCDDTSAAILVDGVMVANLTATQKIHEQYGGVVPELASRSHQANIIPVVHQVLQQCGLNKNEISAVAVTRGPGLMGSLIVGLGFAKSFAQALNIPIIEVNHMQAHVLAHFIDDPKPTFPFLCLTVSGGHTQIVLIEDHLKMSILGETLDDAAGEAFDKAAKMLGLPYPGGPLVDKYAKEGNPDRFSFPIPAIPSLNFSFSGTKTAILYFLRDQMKENPHFIQENLPDICASIQKNIVHILLSKLKKAAQETGIKEIAIAGGVSANSGLRNGLIELGEKKGWNTYIPQFQYCTDNAAMIAITGYYKYLKGDFAALDMTPLARWEI
ncbi:MAG: tRNA (adenosine(37)-N6)-threonylcarbamoyltransferase complex transferase subunit TsaD [Chitinophagales bacterium]|nr:tRNA (adenosine(37)-N6)-threonylcarbamoyltransferase complex transferase subunit TsaD [Chitinophagales bacterium]